MRRRLVLTAAISALTIALTGCTGGGTDSGGGKGGQLEFLTGTAVDSPLYGQYQDLVKKFEADHSGVKVNLVPSSTDHEGDLKVRLASGNIPDIWMTHGWSLLRYGKFLMPLQNEPWAKDLAPALKPAMLGQGGELYAMPVDTDIAGLLYNADVLAEAGVKPDDIKTWDDFNRAAAAIKAKGETPIYAAGKDQWPTGLFVDWIAPGVFSEAELKSMKEGTFAEGSYTKVLDTVGAFREAGLFNKDYSSATTDNVARALAEGKTGFSFLMNFVATSAFEYKKDARIGFMPVPTANGGKPYLISGEKNALGINKDTKHPKEAKELLAFLAQPENLTKLAKASGSAPGLTSAQSDLGGLQSSYDTYVKSGAVPTVPYFDRVYMPNGAWDTMVKTTDGVVTKQSTVADSVAKVKTDFTKLYAQAK
ncbi:ABC transporter substrate-binding protein [Micromonospora sp. WMMD754]|uniref:ABC transporter substrate-binding protein n=1 Tax=Micromonospora sp. WMMD754 TaxID=3404114 RepID=UPI003BF4BFCE